MLRRLQPTKERVEPTILSTKAIEIRLPILLGSLFYCCYEFHDICGVITSPYWLILITVEGIWI